MFSPAGRNPRLIVVEYGPGADVADALSAEELVGLAHSRSPGDRDRLLLAVVELAKADAGGGGLTSPAVQGLLSSIFMSLVVEAERDIRIRLADRLAAAPWAPPALINVLVLDEIDIAAPVIAKSPVLQDADLVRLLLEATVEHQIEVARRPGIGAPVVAAILDKGEAAVVMALASNLKAALSEGDMQRLVELSRRIAALRAPLARRPELTAELAKQLYAWVGQALRDTLVGRFKLDVAALDAELAHAVKDAHAGHDATAWPSTAKERVEMERRLVAKLRDSGQLRPAYLVRALREQRLPLFESALCALGGFTHEDVQEALDASAPDRLALACAAVGIDKSAFGPMLQMVRQLNGGRPGGGAVAAERAMVTFSLFTPDMASAAFRRTAAAV